MEQVQWIQSGTWPRERPNWCPIREILVQRLDCGAETPNHYHVCHEYYIVCAGEAVAVLDNQRFVIRQGDVVAIHRGARHHLEQASKDFCYVALRDAPEQGTDTGRILDARTRRFIGYQGRYEDGPVRDEDIPADCCGVMNARTWFWLKQRPAWAWMTSLGHIVFSDGGEEPDYHKHECDEIYLCVSGHLTALVGDRYYEMHEGDIVTIPLGTYHRVACSHGESTLAYFYGELQGLRRYGHLEDGRDEWVL